MMPDTGMLTSGELRNVSRASRDPSVEAWDRGVSGDGRRQGHVDTSNSMEQASRR